LAAPFPKTISHPSSGDLLDHGLPICDAAQSAYDQQCSAWLVREALDYVDGVASAVLPISPITPSATGIMMCS
jgi:hypothetical protein